jgi:hypothetical protein
MEPYFDG